MGYIQGVPEVMQVSAFMTISKCPELARPFVDQVPQTVTEMMKMVNDFVKSEEAYKSTKLPKGEHSEKGQGTSYKGNRPPCSGYGSGYQRTDNYGRRDHYQPCVTLRAHDRRYDSRRYCDYHGEKGHYTNDCYQLKRQLEAALESRKLSHLVKDVRQWGNNRGRQPGNNNSLGKVIIMIRERDDSRKRKSWRSQGEEWTNVPITFPPVPTDDTSDDLLIVEAEARLTPTQTELVGFSSEQLIPIGKVELKVTFGGGGLSRTVMLKFTVVRASSLYNSILGRTGMRELKKRRPNTMNKSRKDGTGKAGIDWGRKGTVDKLAEEQHGRVRMAAFGYGQGS
ncbi:hypothetical protein Tco_1128408 [Tanacetum coccineum]